MTAKTDTMPTAIEERDILDHELKFDRVLLGLYESDEPRDEVLIEVLKDEIDEKEMMLDGFYRLLGEAKGETVDLKEQKTESDRDIEDSQVSDLEIITRNHGITGPITPREMQRKLERGGFNLVQGRGKGSHVIFKNDEGISVPIPVHGDIGKGLAVTILRQAGLI